MNRLLSILLVLAMLVLLPAGLLYNIRSAGTAREVTVSTYPAEKESQSEEAFDLTPILTELVSGNPDASCEELCDMLLENPYFRLFRAEPVQDYYPALDYEFQPEGIKSAACIWDPVSGSGAVVYVFEPEEDTDAEAFMEAVGSAVDPWWSEEPLNTLFLAESGKFLFAMYPDEMTPVEGPVAEKARDLVEIFHDYLSEHPDAQVLELADYFAAHQKISELYTGEVVPGRLTGFGDFENEVQITGFEEGATFAPVISPNTFIGYVFRLKSGDDTAAFEKLLQDSANLFWNVCVGADTVITEADGTYVLFMMCTENTER